MTQYDDIPKINALHLEQQAVQTAISTIDNGGILASYVIGPAPPDDPSAMMAMPMVTPVNINVTGVVPPDLMAAMRVQLEERSATITEELATLGVT